MRDRQTRTRQERRPALAYAATAVFAMVVGGLLAQALAFGF